jgi:phosphate transport system protein
LHFTNLSPPISGLLDPCVEIAYGFSRFGRYAYDIVEVLETIDPIPDCDKTQVLEMAKIVREMIQLSVHSLETRDKNAAAKLSDG